jgi:hypothetical protein
MVWELMRPTFWPKSMGEGIEKSHNLGVPEESVFLGF